MTVCPYCQAVPHGRACPLAAFDQQMREVLAHLTDLVTEVHTLWRLSEQLKAGVPPREEAIRRDA